MPSSPGSAKRGKYRVKGVERVVEESRGHVERGAEGGARALERKKKGRKEGRKEGRREKVEVEKRGVPRGVETSRKKPSRAIAIRTNIRSRDERRMNKDERFLSLRAAREIVRVTAKRNETKRNETKRNGTERNGTERNGTERNETERNASSLSLSLSLYVYICGSR